VVAAGAVDVLALDERFLRRIQTATRASPRSVPEPDAHLSTTAAHDERYVAARSA